MDQELKNQYLLTSGKFLTLPVKCHFLRYKSNIHPL